MFKLDPKERWGYNDLEKIEQVRDWFGKYKKLSIKDEMAEKIKWIIEEGRNIYGAIDKRERKAQKEKEK